MAISMATRASYVVVSVQDDLILLKDLDGKVSVTNDAENVVKEVIDWKGQFTEDGRPYRIHYFDTDGNRDELLHDKGRFTGFAPARDAK